MNERKLDIVRDNIELTFPSNIDYKFVFWEHTTENIPRVVPELQDVDILALEYTHTGSDPVTPAYIELVDQFFSTLSSVTEGTADSKTYNSVLGFTESDSALGHFSSLAIALKDTDLQLKPVDTGVVLEEHLDDSLIETSLEEHMSNGTLLTDYLRHREGIIIRQLSQIGHEAAKDGAPKTIGVLYGAHHEMLSIAARQLGASVSRVFVDKPEYDSFSESVISRMIRFGSYDDPEAVPSHVRERLDMVDVISNMLPARQDSRLIYLLKQLEDLSIQDPQYEQRMQDAAAKLSLLQHDALHLRGLRRIVNEQKIRRTSRSLFNLAASQMPHYFRDV